MQRLNVIHHPSQASFQSSFNTWSIQISNRWKLSFIKICKTVARDSIKICSKRMEQFPSESEPGVTSFKGRRQWYESTILEFRFHSLRVRGENSHKNQIATSSSRFYSVCNCEGVWFILGRRTTRDKEGKGGVEGWFTWWKTRPYDPSWFIRSRVRGFPPSLKKSEAINRHWQIDVLNSQADQDVVSTCFSKCWCSRDLEDLQKDGKVELEQTTENNIFVNYKYLFIYLIWIDRNYDIFNFFSSFTFIEIV